MSEYYELFKQAIDDTNNGIKRMSDVYVMALNESPKARANFKARFNIPFSTLDRLERIGKGTDIVEMFFVGSARAWKTLSTMTIEQQQKLILYPTELIMNNDDVKQCFFSEMRVDEMNTVYDEKTKTIRSIEQQREYRIRLNKINVSNQEKEICNNYIRNSFIKGLNDSDLSSIPTNKLIKALLDRDLNQNHLDKLIKAININAN